MKIVFASIENEMNKYNLEFLISNSDKITDHTQTKDDLKNINEFFIFKRAVLGSSKKAIEGDKQNKTEK
ncbi:hypothetical protein ACMUEP_14230 [Enterobacter nematophilus]|uniref:hypothetical protein n=1 Tax=Enterobacter nematophilus TaxID=2994648 RepID=UPI0039C9CB4E